MRSTLRTLTADSEKILFWSLLIFFMAAITFIAVGREYFAYSTETDYLAGFIHDAKDILSGSPLALEFHPPLYPAIVALFYLFTGDWLTTGLIISWTGALIVLVTQYKFFKTMEGNHAAFGALIALGTSHIFLMFSAQSTSDVISFALYSLTLLIMYRAYREEETLLWIAAGILVGLSQFIRSNMLVLLFLFVTPFLLQGKRTRLRSLGLLTAGFLLPVITWIVIAGITGSNLWTQKNHVNIAMTYFGQDHYSGDALRQMEDEFSSLFQVLTHDPVHMIKQYIFDFMFSFRQLLLSRWVVTAPVALLFLPGLFLFLTRKLDRFKILFILVTFLHLLLINLKGYLHRFYIFLIPVIGVCAALAYFSTTDKIRRSYRPYIHLFMALLVVISFVVSFGDSREKLHRDDALITSLIRNAGPEVEPGSSLITIHPQPAFYLDAEYIYFPRTRTLNGLQAAILDRQFDAPVYLLYSPSERNRRPELASLQRGESSVPWLHLVAENRNGKEWALYRVEVEESY